MRRFALPLLICIAVPAAASDAVATKEKPKVEETIVVTATRSERAVSELPISTTVLREAEIKATPAITIDDLLRTIPGVHMPLSSTASTTVQSQRFSMHGLGGTRALVLLDGVPMHDPFYGTIEWQKVPLDSLRQIEVVRGGNASLFGNFALGGTINLLTRPVDQSELRLDTSYGSNATQRIGLTVDQAVTERFGLRLSHHRFNSDGTIRIPTPGLVDVPGWNDTAITNARAEYRPSDRTSAFLRASKSQIDVSQGTVLSQVKRGIFDVSAGAQHALGRGSLLSTTLFHQDEKLRIANTTVTTTRSSEFISTSSRIPGNNSGGSLEWSMQRSGAVSFIAAGVDVQDTEATEYADSLNRNAVVTQRDALTGHQRFAGVFAQASWHPTARLEILTSARLDSFTNDRAADVIEGGATITYPSTKSTQLDPRVSFRYAVGEHSALRGAAYRAFKAPTLRELYRNTQSGSTLLLANPNLEPETLVGAELGVEWAAARTHLEINAYRNDIDGLQVRAQVPGQPPNVVKNFNLGTGRSQGVEASADVALSSRFSLKAGYTFADTKITESPDLTLLGKQFPDAARHIGSLAVRYRGDGGTMVDLRGRTVSRSYGEPANVVAAPAHRILDIAVSQPVRSWIEVYALLENAFDVHYFYVLTATSFRNGQPRTFTGGVRLHVPTGSARRNP